jgi:hypothetical protein
MPLKIIENRRDTERRVDKITMKARIIVGTLKRTIGANAAKRYLEKNGYSAELIHDMMLSSVERRGSRRRADNRPARVHAKPVNIREEEVGLLTADDILFLYRLRLANNSDGIFIRLSDCPGQFARFGLMEPGPRGARITERGHSTLLHWTRAKALLSVSRGQGLIACDESVYTWLKDNRFIETRNDEIVTTARGTGWLEVRLKILNRLV